MTTNQELAKRPSQQDEAPALVPPVDVTEDDSGITLKADLPGAKRDALAIGIDGDSLTFEAPLDIGVPEGIEPVYAEVRSGRYRRSFTLSRELDTTNIEATLKDGVLTLRLPKQEQAKPRRIEVRTAA